MNAATSTATTTATPTPGAAAPSAAALDWARRLVRFNTVSDQSNRPLIDCIADHLRGLGVPLRLTRDDAGLKFNLFATLGAGKPGGVILSGHTDTVPWTGQAWTVDPLGAELRDGRLYGRGSADMKAFIGLAVAHAEAFLQAELPFAVHLAFSFDEEVGCFGVRHLIADLREAGLAPSRCIVGEPTGMRPAIAHKGVHRWRCCVKGRAVHSSQTPRGVNAIEAAARVVAHLAGMADRWREQGPWYPGFEVPCTTAAVGVIEGGIADNVVPEDCRFHYEFRDVPGADALAMQADVQAAAERLTPAMRAVDPATGFRFEPICSVPAFQAPADDPALALVRALLGTAAGEDNALVGFGTEAGLFQRAGIASVVCGPGFIDQAHQADEFVSLQQLAACEAMFVALRQRPAL
ncbi:MAG: acetylornithine deacetylase [Proteobacteria bacterium]|nr:acetylornithine deacetylase [Pseudomonadota bacterium]